MSYCTQADIQNLLPSASLIQLADDDEDGVADSAVIAAAIADADGKIDAHLQERYTLPLSATPQFIKDLAVDLAVYWLYSRRDIAEENRRKRYEDAMKLLEGLADGSLSLGTDPEEEETGDMPQSTTIDTDRIFDADTMENY